MSCFPAAAGVSSCPSSDFNHLDGEESDAADSAATVSASNSNSNNSNDDDGKNSGNKHSKDKQLVPRKSLLQPVLAGDHEFKLCAEIEALLRCPVCYLPVCTPIYQCQNGHLFCDRCFPCLENRCPLCRTCINPPSRNRALEAMLALFLFPCRYNCNSMVPLSEMRSHERDCRCRPLHCPCPGCKWMGHEVLFHIRDAHPRVLNLDGEQIVFLATDVDIPGRRVNWVMIQKCFGRHFLLWLERCRQQPQSIQDRTSRTFLMDYFYWVSVLLISTDRSDSGRFRYRVELEKRGMRFKKLTWESKVGLIGKSRQDILQSDDCLIISGKLAKYFTQNQRLPLNVTILRNK